jgi:hypothetical protein
LYTQAAAVVNGFFSSDHYRRDRVAALRRGCGRHVAHIIAMVVFGERPQ